jgi:hypothetical protein
MLFISENVEIDFLGNERKYDLKELINLKKYTVSDTPLSYRQANALGTDNLLSNDRKDKSRWRKFSFKELVYIEILSELKGFGMKRDQLRPLWDSFFKEPPKDIKQIDLRNGRDSEVAIGCVFSGIEITLFVDNKGDTFFLDPMYYLRFSISKPLIKISFNQIVNELLKKISLPTVPVTHSVYTLVFNNASVTTDKEKELLGIIRDQNYISVEVKKRDGEIALAYAENHKNGELTTQNLEQILESKNYINISITQRDGKIVSHTIKETIKL